MKTTKLPDAEYLRECFDVCDGLLAWKTRPLNHFLSERSWRCHESKLAGKLAGRIMKGTPYQQVMLDGVRLLGHRIVAHMHGLDTSRCIDHKDGNPQNNHIMNLRPCSQPENTRNNSGWRKKSEPVGVHKKANGRYTAYVCQSGKHKHLGTFTTMAQAATVRVKAELEIYGGFSRYASREFVQSVAADRGVEITEQA